MLLIYYSIVSICHQHYKDHSPVGRSKYRIHVGPQAYSPPVPSPDPDRCFEHAEIYYDGVRAFGSLGEWPDNVPEGLPVERQSPVTALPEPRTPGSKDPLTGLVNPEITPGYKWVRGRFRKIS